MAEDAVRAADAGLDFAAFDNDGPDGLPASGDDDGIVDALIIVHAGSGSETGTPGSILSHTWTTVDVVTTADGVGAWRYSTVAEDSPRGVPAHEFGHLLGLADLYDRRSTTILAGGLGDWSLMPRAPGSMTGTPRPTSTPRARSNSASSIPSSRSPTPIRCRLRPRREICPGTSTRFGRTAGATSSTSSLKTANHEVSTRCFPAAACSCTT
jgi:M6 family metalloprotease-like protein